MPSKCSCNNSLETSGWEVFAFHTDDSHPVKMHGMRTPLLIADELRSMAHAGLLYAGNVYDQHLSTRQFD
jgi:hypothetical protein